MRSAIFRSGLGFPFPENGSSLDIRRRLGRWATLAPTAAKFPWHLAKHLYRVLCFVEPSFPFAECALFCCREAARRALRPLNPGYKRLLIAAIVKHRIEFAAIYYEHLRYRVKAYLEKRGVDVWPECEGLSPLGYGSSQVHREEIATNRRDLLSVIEGTSRWYERTLGFIGSDRDREERASGHKLHHWFEGAAMPAPVEVPVTVEEDGGKFLIAPEKDDAFPLIQAGWDLPEYAVDPECLLFDVAPTHQPARPTAVSLPAPSPIAPDPDIRSTAAKALELATHLDSNPKVKAPNHLTVFRLYCIELLSLREIARRCQCSHATIINRKTALEQRLNLPLDNFRASPDTIRPLAGAAEYARARMVRPDLLAR
jgi:hypothetical protein